MMISGQNRPWRTGRRRGIFRKGEENLKMR
jgi:hypothetical protein